MSIFQSSREVSASPELHRILAIPRRELGNGEEYARELTALLKTPDGTMSLRPIQGNALAEIGMHKRLFGPIRVGGGKTLISLLTPTVLGLKRPLLLLPAALIEKTERERRALSRHWRVAKNLRMMSYEMLGRVNAAHELERHKPDAILADEAHRLKNKRAGVTRRVARYMKEHPETWFMAFSGTILKASLKDFAHLIEWTHKEESPVPLTDEDVIAWAEALDEDSKTLGRPRPGCILRLAMPEDLVDGDELATARKGFHRRLVETAGVVSSAGDAVACSLYIEAKEYTPASVTDQNFATLRSKWETPDGWAFSEAVTAWRHARELALGFHYVWDPRPPDEWLNARRAWAAFVRQTLSRSRTLDTELQVANAVDAGHLPNDGELAAWRDIRDTFKINAKAVWHDETALDVCTKWLKQGPGIVWVEHTFFGAELERRTGVPYFREGGNDKKGNAIELHDPKKPMIASVAANSTGRNLQAWHRNLITSSLTGAAENEQLIGRTHRDGQTADEVEVEILLACVEHFDAWTKARARAQLAQDMLGQPQKILIADSVFPLPEDIERRTGPRWEKQWREKELATDE